MILKYRPEIDGLRAVSIISVILYHATLSFKDINIFEGGFLGVDIFNNWNFDYKHQKRGKN